MSCLEVPGPSSPGFFFLREVFDPDVKHGR